MQNHIVASFGPNETYTRNSEGAFLRLNDGRILFVHSRFTLHGGDNAPSDLVALYSADEGETWSEPVTAIAASMYNTENVMSTSLMRMANGDVGLFYIVKQTPSQSRLMLSRSNDEGKTWYKHVECSLSDRPGYYVLNNDRIERLASGRLLMPLTFHRGAHGDQASYFDGRAIGYFLYSDDDGETWAESPDAVFPPFAGSRSGLQEGGCIQLDSGVVIAYYRTDMMYHYFAYSFDDGLHWTKAQPSRFTGSCSPLKITRRPETGEFYAVWNPIPGYNGRIDSKHGGRHPIVYAVSPDGLTWGEQKIIEADEDCGYCYPAMFFTRDNAMLVAYCAGSTADKGCLNRLTINKLAL